MPRGKRARGTNARDDDADERLCWALERVVADPTIPDDVKGRVRAHCVKTMEAGRVEAYARGSSCARTGMCVLALSTSLREMDEAEAAAAAAERRDEARKAGMEGCVNALESYDPAPVEVKRAEMAARMEWAFGTIRGGRESPEGKKSGKASETPRRKAMAHFWSRWRSVESRAANGALDAIEDDDDVKKTYEFVRKVAVNGGELPSNWEKMVTSREDVVERLETLCDDLKTKVGQSFLSRVDAAIDTEAPGVVINRGLIVQSTSTMSADAYGNLLRSGRRAPPSPSAEAGKATASSPPKRVHIGVERKKSARTVEWESQNDDRAEPEEQSTSFPPRKASSKDVVEPLAELSWGEVGERTPKHNVVSSPAPGIVRQRTRWSKEEEEYLRKGVEKFGLGSWAMILRDPGFRKHFAEQRTSVDLKDKWRVMMQADARKRADKDVQTEVDALAETIMQIRDSSPKQTRTRR